MKIRDFSEIIEFIGSSVFRKKINRESYKHFDKTIIFRDFNGKKIHFGEKSDIGRVFISYKNTLISFREFIVDFLQPENVCSHRFTPFLHVEKPKWKISWKKGKQVKTYKGRKNIDEVKTRPIMYASHTDTLVYKYYGYVWGKIYEEKIKSYGLGDIAIAYRRIHSVELNSGKNNINYARDAFEFIKKQEGDIVAYAFDVSGFFENIDHIILTEKLKELLGVDRLNNDDFVILKHLTLYDSVMLESLEKAIKENPQCKGKDFEGKICDPQTLRHLFNEGKVKINKNTNGKGIPQGSPISGLLANLYMMKLDYELHQFTSSNSCYYARYSDDIVLIGKNDCLIEAKRVLMEQLGVLKLEIKEEKTNITFFDGKQGAIKSIKFYKKDKDDASLTEKIIIRDAGKSCPKFEYLGCEFDGMNMRLKSSTLSRFYQKLSYQIRKYRFVPNGRKIILRRFGYPSAKKAKNFGKYVQMAEERSFSDGKIRNQFKRHIQYINAGFQMCRKKFSKQK